MIDEIKEPNKKVEMKPMPLMKYLETFSTDYIFYWSDMSSLCSGQYKVQLIVSEVRLPVTEREVCCDMAKESSDTSGSVL